MEQLTVSVSPHFLGKRTTKNIMLDVIIALLPALIASFIIFGWRSLLVAGVCTASCILSEFFFEKLCKKTADITARIMMLIAFSDTMTKWQFPQNSVDAISGATPLAAAAKGLENLPSYISLFLGNHGGCIGETCSLALILGGIYLLIRKVITWHIPAAFIGTVAFMSLVCGKDPLYQVLSGGLMLGAFFMATDYATSPSTKWGKIIFGIGCGLVTILIRFWGSLPEGVSYSILLMNIFTPYISKLTRQKPLGAGGGAKS